MDKNVVIYQDKSGAIELKGDFKKETFWASQSQISILFGVERSVIAKHIANILKNEELDKNAVCAKFAHTAEDEKTYQVQYYNLDVILAVGYRTNSAKAIKFRKWATETLRKYILTGYVIDKKRVAKNLNKFLNAVENVKKLLPLNTEVKAAGAMDLIKTFASTWLSLDAYDRDFFPPTGEIKRQVKITSENITEELAKLKAELVSKNEAADLFGVERTKGSIASIVGNLFQSWDNKDLYPSVEEKAAHLLYFMVKNHPFIDGNKRSGAFTFVWFLRKAKVLDSSRLTPEALTALTLLVAESEPKNKDRIIGLILMLLRK
jgi:prophage maintenance system killer protein